MSNCHNENNSFHPLPLPAPISQAKAKGVMSVVSNEHNSFRPLPLPAPSSQAKAKGVLSVVTNGNTNGNNSFHPLPLPAPSSQAKAKRVKCQIATTKTTHSIRCQLSQRKTTHSIRSPCQRQFLGVQLQLSLRKQRIPSAPPAKTHFTRGQYLFFSPAAGSLFASIMPTCYHVSHEYMLTVKLKLADGVNSAVRKKAIGSTPPPPPASRAANCPISDGSESNFNCHRENNSLISKKPSPKKHFIWAPPCRGSAANSTRRHISHN